MLQNVNHVTQRSNSDALVTTVLGAAVLGGVRERCPETPFRSNNAILREADVKETGAGTGEGRVMLVFIVGGVDDVSWCYCLWVVRRSIHMGCETGWRARHILGMYI